MIKLKKQIQSKQSGMTAIMLAMFFAIVISLLSVGFATLVRKDQAETLDKTLSYQAQYAAESGVNKAISFIDENPGVGGSDNCSGNIEYNGQSFGKSFKVGEADVTCATWTFGGNEIVLSPSVNIAKTASFKNANSINVVWYTDYYSGFNSDTLPALEDSKRILSLTIAPKDKLGDRKRIYIVPSNESLPPASKLDTGTGEGKVVRSNSYTNGKAEAQIDLTASFGGGGVNQEYLINVSYLNGPDTASDVVITSGAGSSNRLINTSQYKIDVNAKAQDITKRVIVYYNPIGTPGEPYVTNIYSDGNICKDYQVDGSQDKSVSEAGNACPNPPTP